MTKGVHTHPKNNKKGFTAFCRRRRPSMFAQWTRNQNMQRVASSLDTLNQPFFFFSHECVPGERERSKVRCGQVPLIGMLTGGFTPPSLLTFGSPPFGTILPLLTRHVLLCPGRTGSKTSRAGDCASSWLLWHVGKTTSHVETTNGPDPPKRYTTASRVTRVVYILVTFISYVSGLGF